MTRDFGFGDKGNERKLDLSQFSPREGNEKTTLASETRPPTRPASKAVKLSRE